MARLAPRCIALAHNDGRIMADFGSRIKPFIQLLEPNKTILTFLNADNKLKSARLARRQPNSFRQGWTRRCEATFFIRWSQGQGDRQMPKSSQLRSKKPPARVGGGPGVMVIIIERNVRPLHGE